MIFTAIGGSIYKFLYELQFLPPNLQVHCQVALFRKWQTVSCQIRMFAVQILAGSGVVISTWERPFTQIFSLFFKVCEMKYGRYVSQEKHICWGVLIFAKCFEDKVMILHLKNKRVLSQ